MDPVIGTIVVASALEVDDVMSTGMSTRGAKRQQHIQQEDDNQSNVTFEGNDVVDDFGPIIPSPSGEADPMEADLHSRFSISAIHELEIAAYGNHGLPPPAAQLLPLPAGCAPASNTTVPLGTAISLLVDDVLARMSPNTPVEDALLDLYLMLSKAGSPLYIFDEVVGFMEKHAGHTFQKGVTLPRQETLIKQMQQQHNVPPPVPIPVVLENGTEGTPQYRCRRKDSVTVQTWPFEQMIPFCLVTNIIWSMVTTPGGNTYPLTQPMTRKCLPATGSARPRTRA
jgi:hypothetical protein